MYYRPSMLKAAGFDKPPATLDEFVTMVKKMTIDKDGNGSIDQWGYAYRASGVLDGAEIVKAISLLYGVNPDDVKGKVKFNGAETVKAVDFLVKLRNEYKVVPPGVTAYQHGDVADFFLSGNVAIVIDPTYLYARCLDSAIKDDFAIALQPASSQSENKPEGLAPQEGADTTGRSGVDCKILWRYHDSEHGASFRSSAAVTRQAVIVGSRDKQVHAFEPTTGKPLWSFHTKGRVDGSPVVVGRRVFVGSGDGRLYALDVETGKSLWQFEAGGAIVASPAVAGGRLVIGNDSGSLYCFGAK
jgi:outer membrane protein assembly factor BamB